MMTIIRIVCALSITLFTFVANAMPVSQLNIPEAAAAADLIVVGRATYLESYVLTPDHHTVDRPSAILVVKSDRILKGKLPGGGSVTIKADISPGTARIQEYGIFFLRAAGDGTFVGADPRAFSVIAVPATTAVTRDLDPLIAIAQELAAVLETPPSQLVETRTRHKS